MTEAQDTGGKNMTAKNIPETFIPGYAYIAPSEDGPALSPEQLANVQTGPQEHAVGIGEAIKAEEADKPDTDIKNPVSEEALQEIARKYTSKSGKAKAFAVIAQVKRASRRLMLAERSKKLQCICPVSGIVTLLEIPAIPGYALTYEHPLSSLDNARGIAQKGTEYLQRLDTQVLAGILIVLAASYELFRFQTSDTGAQRNAILRTAGKDILIDAIQLIENQIHSRNAANLPHLSLTVDVIADDKVSMQTKMTAYVTLLAESIAKPDLSTYDENAAPKRIGKIPLIKDAEKQAKATSNAYKKAKLVARKELAEDAKVAKTLAANLVSLGFAKPGLKAFMAQVLADNGLALIDIDPAVVSMLINQKLATYDHEDAKKLIAILQKDRSALRETEEDDPAPGQEAAIEETLEDTTVESEVEQEPVEETPTPPAGLSKLEEVLWIKKWKKAQANLKNLATQQDIPSLTTYVPSVDKQKLGKE